jgi:hypothetical protein
MPKAAIDREPIAAVDLFEGRTGLIAAFGSYR